MPPPGHATAPEVIPRWEWRTFGDLEQGTQVLASLGAGEPFVSDETYVLSLQGDASVKVRDGLMDTKVQRLVDDAGFQLWVPTMKAAFPLDGAAVEAVFSALNVGLPTLTRSHYTEEQLVEELISASQDLCVTTVHKRRIRSVLDTCMVELTELTADGTTTHTVAVESPDTALVAATVRRLGLEGRRNTCVAQGLKSLLGWGPARFAVIDVGTNSVKFHLGERRGTQAARTLVDRAVVTRLGEGLAETGQLTEPAMERTCEAIAAMAEEARRNGPVDIVSVGTAGLRQAPNRSTFIKDTFTACGVTVEVISGKEEARLAYRAAVSSLPSSGDRLLVFDSGGGSSQFTFGTNDRPEEQFSLDVGAVRFTERYRLDDVVTRDALDEALAGIAADLAPLQGRERPDAVYAIGGTSTNLAAVKHGLAHYDPNTVHGTVLDLAEIDRQIETYRHRSSNQRREVVGLQPARAEVILAGACIVRTILTVTGQESVTVSDRGLRHGVVAEQFER
ncbi:MAG: hypothetical protein WBG36_10255 [Ornithinimicrobium sp.]